MPDPDPAPDSRGPSEAAPVDGIRNLPAVVPIPAPNGSNGPESRDGWFAWLRSLFGRKSDLAASNGLSLRESTMFTNILALRERQAVDVMVPRADIIAVQRDLPLGDLMKVFESAGHSRLVVYDETLDDAIGMVHIRDLIAYMTSRAAVSAQSNSCRKKPFPTGLDLKAVDLSTPLSEAGIIRPILFVPPSMPAMDLLARMQTSHTHLALVVDEFGGTDGVVSIEDIVEQIVGEIADEHDEDEPPDVIHQPDGSFLADARAQLEDVTAIVGPEFDVGEVAKEVDTLGGYIAIRIGRVPVRGELIPGPGRFELEVLDADPRRVKKLKISQTFARKDGRRRDATRRLAPPSPSTAAATPSTQAELPVTRDTSVKLAPDDSRSKD